MSLWTFAEDALLKHLVESSIRDYGSPKWVEIAKGLGERGSQTCRCRWRRLKEGEKCQLLGQWKNLCLTCGMPRRGHSCPGMKRVLPRRSSARQGSRRRGHQEDPEEDQEDQEDQEDRLRRALQSLKGPEPIDYLIDANLRFDFHI